MDLSSLPKLEKMEKFCLRFQVFLKYLTVVADQQSYYRIVNHSQMNKKRIWSN